MNSPDAAASIATRATFRDDREASLMAARAERTSASDLPDGESDLFLRVDLDKLSRFEITGEFRICAHASGAVFGRDQRNSSADLIKLICPARQQTPFADRGEA